MNGNESSPDSGGGPRQSAVWVDARDPAADVRIGEARRVKGGSTVSSFMDEPPAAAEASGDGGRVISDSEVAERGLLQERVIEIGEMREEPVVSKQAVVREELVVRKDVEERTQRISETLRRTEVDVEGLEAGVDPQDPEGPRGV